jgi:hypothetical protein
MKREEEEAEREEEVEREGGREDGPMPLVRPVGSERRRRPLSLH